MRHDRTYPPGRAIHHSNRRRELSRQRGRLLLQRSRRIGAAVRRPAWSRWPASAWPAF